MGSSWVQVAAGSGEQSSGWKDQGATAPRRRPSINDSRLRGPKETSRNVETRCCVLASPILRACILLPKQPPCALRLLILSHAVFRACAGYSSTGFFEGVSRATRQRFLGSGFGLNPTRHGISLDGLVFNACCADLHQRFWEEVDF